MISVPDNPQTDRFSRLDLGNLSLLQLYAQHKPKAAKFMIIYSYVQYVSHQNV